MAELPVYLRIVDVNDNNPVFLQPSYQVLNKQIAPTKGFRGDVKKVYIHLLFLSGYFSTLKVIWWHLVTGRNSRCSLILHAPEFSG